MRSDLIEGHEWETYVALVRCSVTEHGMAYRPRGPRSRSRGSSRGGHVPPGRAGEPLTRRSLTGRSDVRSREVRERRNAKAEWCIIREMLSKRVTGEPRDTEIGHAGFGGGPLEKYPSR